MARHAMTVAELIKDLQQMPPDSLIVVPTGYTSPGEGWEITGVYHYAKTGNVGLKCGSGPYSTAEQLQQ